MDNKDKDNEINGSNTKEQETANTIEENIKDQVENEHNKNYINKIQNMNNFNKINLLKKIFKFDESKQQYFPIIRINSNKDIINIFNNGRIPKYNKSEELFTFIKEQIDIIDQIKKIVGNSYELLQILVNYLEKNNISFIEYFIDLYIECIKALHSQNPIEDILQKTISNNELIKEIKNTINWLMSCGFLSKINLDYVYQKISELQLKNKLESYILYEYLDLIEILYGKKYSKEYKAKLIAKSYLYFYNKEKSGIMVNISNENNININKGCSIIIWFYLNNQNNNNDEFILCDMKVNDNENLEFILNNQNDIIIKYNDCILCEHDKKVFNICKFKWIQLKIQMNKNQIKLNLFQEDLKSLINKKITEEEENEKIEKRKYETKIYNLKDINNITSMNFFKNYLGIVGTIIFCNNDNPSEIPIYSLHGLESNKISNFIGEAGLSNIYFIFTPSLFISEQYKFIDLSNNIIGVINNDKNNKDVIEFNNVYKYKNFVNNIYNLGGTSNLLPLFEMLYKFMNEAKNNNEEEEKLLLIIFKKLIHLLELIFINKKKII